MKKALLIAVLVGIFSGCRQTSEDKLDKANKLIKEEMFKTLYDFQAYEPIESIIDKIGRASCRERV